jgi:phenylalanyl-tRNA synthetase beta chain
MQIPISWINQFVEIETIELNALIEKLTLGGFEVEEILELDINDRKEIVLDISATANRSDSLSIQGIGKEIATLLNQSIIISNYSRTLPLINWKKLLENNVQSIETNNDCVMLVAISVENVNNFIVPKWISQKLLSSGIVPSNNLLDFQNYILLETGYPFSFYDFEKIKAKTNKPDFKLSIAPATEKQTFLGKDNIKYTLDESILTVNCNELPLSIAGIVEAEDVSYSNDTKALLIEASIFKAAKIRQQSRKLGVRTDRSARYEKSLKSTYLLESLYRLILLLRISNPNLSCKLHTIDRMVEPTPNSILLRYETIQEILGPTNNSSQDSFIKPQIISDYLTRLSFNFKFDEFHLSWKVQVPNSRTEDISREIDLIEEIARLHGFNNFLTQLPKIKRIGNEDSNYKTRKKITTCLLNLGFNELIHYSLVNETTFLKNEIQLINPLVADYSSLRSTLLPNLIKTFQENFKQKNKLIEGFEYGHIFLKDPLTDFQEKEYVAGIFGGSQIKTSWSDSGAQPDWFAAKGKMEQFFDQLNLGTYWKSSTGKYIKSILHPYRTAELYVSNENDSLLGTFGQINPILANQLNIPSKIYLFEFDIELITKQLQINNLPLYNQYSLYPKIIKDLSFIIQKDIEFAEIQKLLYSNGTEFLSEINLLDEYRGQSIPDNHISLCLQLIFQSPTRTLENKEIEVILKNLQLILITKYNAIIRQ